MKNFDEKIAAIVCVGSLAFPVSADYGIHSFFMDYSRGLTEYYQHRPANHYHRAYKFLHYALLMEYLVAKGNADDG